MGRQLASPYHSVLSSGPVVLATRLGLCLFNLLVIHTHTHTHTHTHPTVLGSPMRTLGWMEGRSDTTCPAPPTCPGALRGWNPCSSFCHSFILSLRICFVGDGNCREASVWNSGAVAEQPEELSQVTSPLE